MNSPSLGYEPILYVNADADRVSGGVVLREAKKEFSGFEVRPKDGLPIDIVITAALRRADAATGAAIEFPAPLRLTRYLKDRLEQRFERLRMRN